MLRRAADHKGGTFTEIFQNCNVFNDDAFVSFTDKAAKEDRQIFVEHGKPLLVGEGKKKGLAIDARTLSLRVVNLADGSAAEKDVLVHDESGGRSRRANGPCRRQPGPALGEQERREDRRVARVR